MTTDTQLLADHPAGGRSRVWSWRGARLDRLIETPPEPRVLILSASVGAGHVRAAQAIRSALDRMLPHASIAHVDVLQLTNALFRRAYGKGYIRAVERAP